MESRYKPSNAVIFDYETGFVALYADLPFSCFGRYSQQTALTWDEVPGDFDDVTLKPDDPAGTRGDRSFSRGT